MRDAFDMDLTAPALGGKTVVVNITSLKIREKCAHALTRSSCINLSIQLLCGVCGSYSGHLYERLAGDLGSDDGLTMKSEFCTGLTTACDSQITFPDYDGEDYCTMHTGGGDDLWWSYPYERSESMLH